MDSTTTRLPGQCTATTKDGSPCRGFALQGGAFCFAHEPSLAEKRHEARSRGGRARHGRKLATTGDGQTVEIHDLADVVAVITREINTLLTLEKSISRARAVGYLAGVLVSVYTQSELEQRIAALEAHRS